MLANLKRTTVKRLENRWTDPQRHSYSELGKWLNHSHSRHVSGYIYECPCSRKWVEKTGDEIPALQCCGMGGSRIRKDRDGRTRCVYWKPGLLEQLHAEGLVAVEEIKAAGNRIRSHVLKIQTWRVLPVLTPAQASKLNPDLQKSHADWIKDFGELVGLTGGPYDRLHRWEQITEATLTSMMTGYQEHRRVTGPYQPNSHFLRLPRRKNMANATPESQLNSRNAANVTPESQLSDGRTANVTPESQLRNGNIANVTPESQLNSRNAANVTPESQLSDGRTANVTPESQLNNGKSANVTPESQLSDGRTANVTPESQLDHRKTSNVTPESQLDHRKTSNVTPESQLRNGNIANVTPESQLDHRKTSNVTPESQLDHRGIANVTPESQLSDRSTANVTPESQLENGRAANVTPESQLDHRNTANVTRESQLSSEY